MLKRTIYLLSIITLSSCGKSHQAEQIPASSNPTADSITTLNDPKINLNIQTNSFTEVDSSGILMFPLSMGVNNRDEGSSGYKEMVDNRYWNIIFLNSKTNAYHLLSNRKMLISSYTFKTYEDDRTEGMQTKRHLFYSVILNDFNKDKILTESDPKYLFVSDKQGNGFRQISPSNYHLENWEYIKSSNKVLMTLRKMSHKKQPDYKNEVTTFEVDIDKGTAPREVFSQDFKNQLKLLYARDWKRIKE